MRLKLLDLFCCAGGAAMGYHEAGFNVVGVDIKPQPRYPFEFIQDDVLSLDPLWFQDFDAVHASPPCQGYSDMRHAPGTKGAPQLIGQVRAMLRNKTRSLSWSHTRKIPYVIENVEGARSEMRDPITLCGSAFGLSAQGCELRRHRLFESNVPLTALPCSHGTGPVVGIYGGHARIRSARHGGRGTKDTWPNGHKPVAVEAMQMPWATLAEMSEAIPPAYTKFIGQQLMAYIGGVPFTTPSASPLA